MGPSGYVYHSGANVVIEIEGMAVLECCGIRYSEMESKRPIYGYSSRHFDAMATGQVLVEGALLINFVDHNYLFRAIEMGLRKSGQLRTDIAPPLLNPTNELQDQLRNEGNALSLLQQYALDPASNPGIATAIKDSQWTPLPNTDGSKTYVPSPHDSFGGLDIKITYGDREEYNLYSGMTSTLIKNLYFTGRGLQIAIDESVIVEEYPFIARQIVHEEHRYVASNPDAVE